jgi:hypothetical protein
MTQTSNGHKLLEGLVIDERYGIFRSFRRGAIIRAQEVGGVFGFRCQSSRPMAKCGGGERSAGWLVDEAKGRQAGGSMRKHYKELFNCWTPG